MNDSDNEFFCQCCFDDITNENMVKYQINNNSKWLTSNYCEHALIFKERVEIFTIGLKKQIVKKRYKKYLMLDLLLIYVINQVFPIL